MQPLSDSHLAVAAVAPVAPVATEPLPFPRITIQVDVEGRWFRGETGRLVHLDRTRVMRRLVKALTHHHLNAPGETLSTDALFAAAWPDENVARLSAHARVYMALSRLRAYGLSRVIAHDGTGYRIAHNVTVEMKTPA